MARTGQLLDNPVTGERIIFRRTAADTRGELVEIEVALRCNASVAGAHVHPFQEERFRVLSGSVAFWVDGEQRVAKAGDELIVPAGTPHKFRNAGTGEARFTTEVRPALRFEQLLETMFGLAADGLTSKRGLPNLLRLSVIGQAFFDTVRLPYVPAVLQRAVLGLGAPLGRAVGYTPFYAPAATPEPTVP